MDIKSVSWKKVFADPLVVSIYVVVSGVLLFVAAENFIYGIHAGNLIFREVDDLAFQISVQHLRNEIVLGHWGTALSSIDYGYGNIYWLPISVATFPLEYLRIHFGLDWPLLVFPRQLSLGFAVATIFVLRKTALRIGATPRLAAIVVLVYVLFPFVGYFSMRFGTVSEIVFFASLSILLAIRYWQGASKTWFWAILALAIGVAIKLTAVFVAPVVLVLIVRGMWKSNGRKTLFIAPIAGAVFVFISVFLIDPMLVLRFGSGRYLTQYLNTMETFVRAPQRAAIVSYDAISAQLAFFGSVAFAFVGLILFVGLFTMALRRPEFRLFYITALASILFSAIYLLTTVRVTSSVAVYFTIFLPLLALGIIGIRAIDAGKQLGKIFICLIVFTLVADNAVRVANQRAQPQSVSNFSATSYLVTRIKDEQKIGDSEKLAQAMPELLKEDFSQSILLDYSAPVPFNALTNPKACITYVFDNLDSNALACSAPPRYIILDLGRIGSISDQEFANTISNYPDQLKQSALLNRKNRQLLQSAGTFAGVQYQLISQIDGFQVFRRTSE